MFSRNIFQDFFVVIFFFWLGRGEGGGGVRSAF